ncbi:MAG: two-component sensor histidine kinase [Paenibacillaceae bacterium]|jgi:two-component system sensor histidine kinase CssS|nr:two-component sensor histidine kinase [Paenibacillaceae bacterium]
MRNKPLAFQIWIVIVCITVGIFLLVSLLLPPFLNKNLSRSIYSTIEQGQKTALRRGTEILPQSPSAIERDQEQQDRRAVKSFVLGRNGQPLTAARGIPANLADDIYKEALAQTTLSARYMLDMGDERVYYVIRKVSPMNRQFYYVSYMWDTYYKDLMNSLIRQLVALTGILVLLSLFPAIWLSRYLSRPLVKLGGFVKSIADRQWNEPLAMNRKDEIGMLADSIEIMRERLKRQDDYQQTMLQHISHELKTPVMVIASYTQSIQDGIYPQGSLENSLSVIEQESGRLDKKINDLLYLTKLDYLAAGGQIRQEIKLDALVESVVDRLRWKRKELDYLIELAPSIIHGDPEQWVVAVENLLDNQIRYACSKVVVRLEEIRGGGHEATDGHAFYRQEAAAEPAPARGFALILGNDGPPLSEESKNGLFQTFGKGQGGQFGLGLAIVRRIAELHLATVTAANTSEGVQFRILLPVHP